MLIFGYSNFFTKTKNMKKIVLIVFCAILGLSTTFAQKTTVKGRLNDSKGAPVPSATVKEKGTTNAVKADENGNFSISVSPKAVLQISAVGFSSVEVAADKAATISLNEVVDNLNEVVVTAQGIRKKQKEIGYAYAQVSNEEINVGRSPQLAGALSGKVSGLAIYNVNNSVDPAVKVVLRGYRSLTGNNEALIVLDGMQTTSTVLALINPNDVDNVIVLKGGQAASLYGSAGINGAIVITTKKGTKGKLKVTYSNTTNLDQISFLPWFQNEYGNGSHYATSFGSPGYKTNYLDRMFDNWRPFENQQYGEKFDGKPRIIGRQTEDGSQNIIPYSAVDNARRKSFDIGVSTNNQVSFTGGDDNGSFYMSVENNKINGIVPGDKSERTGVRASSTRQYGNFTVGFTVGYTQAAYDRTTSGFYFDLFNVAPNVPIHEYKDWQTNKFANPNGFYDDYYNNPYFNKDNNRNKYNDANIQGTVDLNYKFNSWLSASNKMGIMNNSRTSKSRTGKFLYSDWAKGKAFVPAPWAYANDYDGIDRAGTDILGAVGDGSSTENVLNNDLQLHLDKSFGKFSNKLTLGFNVYQRKTKSIAVSSSSVVIPDVYNISNRQGEAGAGESNGIERKFGYYADLTTTYKEWLTFNPTVRFDNTSRFYKVDRPSDTYSYAYYGAALSAVITDAIPSLKSRTLNFAKLRVNYNKNGNDNLPLYGLDLTYPNGGGFPFGNVVGLTVGNTLPDANLVPEFVTTYEAGGEFQLFNNRINLDVTYYTATSKGQVITVKVPNTTGFSNLLINVGESKNWGYEADLKVQIIRKRDLKWDMGLRYSYNDNEVVDLYPGVNQFVISGGGSANTNVIKGQSFPQLKTDGYNYAADGSGRRLVDAASGYPTRNTALVERGRTLPKDIIGLNSKLVYKNLSMAFNFEYRGGNVMYSAIGSDMTFTGSGGWTTNRAPHIFPNSAFVDGSGKITDNNVLVREPEYGLWVDNFRRINENFVNPAWFIKLRDINIAYNFSPELMKKTKIFSGASIALYGRNLFTIVDKANFYTDPEFANTSGNGIGINDSGQTPPVRQYGININLIF